MSKEEKTISEIFEKVTPTHFEMDKQDELHLQEEVRILLKKDIRALSLVRNLCKTDRTFENSSGNLYLFLKDEETCANCPKKITNCPKRQKGFRFHLVYDRDRDEIKTELKECQLKIEKDKILERIKPSDCNPEECLEQFNSFFDFFIKHKDKNPLQEILNFFVSVKNSLSDFSLEKNHKGYSLFCINDAKLSGKINKAICFMFAKVGISCAYINLSSLFYDLNSKDYQVKENALRDYKKICSLPALFLENMNLIGTFDVNFYEEYLYPLLKKRSEKGKVTYCSLSSSYPLDKVIYSKMKGSEHLLETQQLTNQLFEKKVFNVFDVR